MLKDENWMKSIYIFSSATFFFGCSNEKVCTSPIVENFFLYSDDIECNLVGKAKIKKKLYAEHLFQNVTKKSYFYKKAIARFAVKKIEVI